MESDLILPTDLQGSQPVFTSLGQSGSQAGKHQGIQIVHRTTCVGSFQSTNREYIATALNGNTQSCQPVRLNESSIMWSVHLQQMIHTCGHEEAKLYQPCQCPSTRTRYTSCLQPLYGGALFERLAFGTFVTRTDELSAAVGSIVGLPHAIDVAAELQTVLRACKTLDE